MIKVESGSFAALVRSYKKSLNMLAVLQHICEDNCVELSMLPDEVCELINLDPAEIEKQRLSGRLRFAEEENGTRHYSIVDIINLKDSIDWKVINRQVKTFPLRKRNDGVSFFPLQANLGYFFQFPITNSLGTDKDAEIGQGSRFSYSHPLSGHSG